MKQPKACSFVGALTYSLLFWLSAPIGLTLMSLISSYGATAIFTAIGSLATACAVIIATLTFRKSVKDRHNEFHFTEAVTALESIEKYLEQSVKNFQSSSSAVMGIHSFEAAGSCMYAFLRCHESINDSAMLDILNSRYVISRAASLSKITRITSINLFGKITGNAYGYSDANEYLNKLADEEQYHVIFPKKFLIGKQWVFSPLQNSVSPSTVVSAIRFLSVDKMGTDRLTPQEVYQALFNRDIKCLSEFIKAWTLFGVEEHPVHGSFKIIKRPDPISPLDIAISHPATIHV